MEALPPNVAHITRRTAKAQLFPPSSESQGTRWDSPDTHIHNPWISIPVSFPSALFYPIVLKGNDFTQILLMIACRSYDFLPANKTGLSHSVLLPICSTLRVGLLKSASNYHQLPEEWPFSSFASLYRKVEHIFCLFLSPKYIIKISTYLLRKRSVPILLSKTWD